MLPYIMNSSFIFIAGQKSILWKYFIYSLINQLLGCFHVGQILIKTYICNISHFSFLSGKYLEIYISRYSLGTELTILICNVKGDLLGWLTQSGVRTHTVALCTLQRLRIHPRLVPRQPQSGSGGRALPWSSVHVGSCRRWVLMSVKDGSSRGSSNRTDASARKERWQAGKSNAVFHSWTVAPILEEGLLSQLILPGNAPADLLRDRSLTPSSTFNHINN